MEVKAPCYCNYYIVCHQFGFVYLLELNLEDILTSFHLLHLFSKSYHFYQFCHIKFLNWLHHQQPEHLHNPLKDLEYCLIEPYFILFVACLNFIYKFFIKTYIFIDFFIPFLFDFFDIWDILDFFWIGFSFIFSSSKSLSSLSSSEDKSSSYSFS